MRRGGEGGERRKEKTVWRGRERGKERNGRERSMSVVDKVEPLVILHTYR